MREDKGVRVCFFAMNEQRRQFSLHAQLGVCEREAVAVDGSEGYEEKEQKSFYS